jgi:hypothetical protein
VKIPINFCGGSYQSLSPIIDNERSFNCFPERAELPTETTQIAQLPVPGKRVYAVLGDEIKVPGQYEINGRTFAACSNLWELTSSGPVNHGSLGSVPTTPTQMFANETQLVILNNGNLYVMVLATNLLSAVNMAQFNGPIAQIGFADGYVIATLQNSHTFQQSNLEDATTWDGLNISTISYFPDNITSMVCDHREPWFFSGKKAIGYYNAGAGFPVFIPIQGAFIENGAGATWATVQLDNSVMWLDQDDRGNMVARRLNGYVGERISTFATEQFWQSYGTTSDAVGWTYQMDGHLFWIIYFPTANKTWGYDVATKFWHERGSWDTQTGKYIADRAMSHVFTGNIHLVGDPFSGTVYQLDPTIHSEAGKIIRGFRRSPVVFDDNKWLYLNQIEFNAETGQTPDVPLFDGDGQPRPAQVMLRWSKDAGRTWSNTYTLSLGFPGEFEKRVIKRMLGRGRKFVFELSWTDPVAVKIAEAFLEGEAAD